MWLVEGGAGTPRANFLLHIIIFRIFSMSVRFLNEIKTLVVPDRRVWNDLSADSSATNVLTL